ncbi:aminotransferase class V-fold PLP-dependent enzyme [Streptomyces roseirectus]|uniref:Aminotransferase class V-fold PLP-dependent enzyme n=1 Tax=Streptomyces roseirectus TaxID=2768066 RepID=A0A7H0IT78_9ACTN|nr:aminotransferase class V-fold PLP-dependent enzyme [Streptomyces roseirectus]
MRGESAPEPAAPGAGPEEPAPEPATPDAEARTAPAEGASGASPAAVPGALPAAASGASPAAVPGALPAAASGASPAAASGVPASAASGAPLAAAPGAPGAAPNTLARTTPARTTPAKTTPASNAPAKTTSAKAASAPDALVTTGGTESNHLALLLAREAQGPGVRLVCGANAHHSLTRAAWLLGLPEPVVVPTPEGVLEPAALDDVLARLDGPLLVAATAGTTDAGLIDPLPGIAARCAAHGARLHVDAAYGGGLLFSDRHRGKLAGTGAADTVTLDLHKLGWQPVAAGLLAVRDAGDLAVLRHRADYLNADDDTEAGLPDLLGRSLRTTRRPDVLKVAVTLKTLGRTGLGALVDQVCALAQEFADRVAARPGLELYARPVVSTVLFRPVDADVAVVRRALLEQGRAVLGRARTGDGRLWLKATLLNPHTGPADLDRLLNLVEGTTPR